MKRTFNFGRIFRFQQIMKEHKKILIIDDEPDFGFLMKTFFNKRGFDVLIANSLAKGLQLLKEEHPDYIFLDNNLPDGLGWGKTDFILANYPSVNLNLISALEVPKTSNSSFRILYKPFIKDELVKMFE